MSTALDAREALIEAIRTATALRDGSRLGNIALFQTDDVREILDAALSARTSRPCETCGGDGLDPSGDAARWYADHGQLPVCEFCRGAGTIPGGYAIVDVLVERGVLEQVGWQYAHDHNGPLANLRQAAACADTVPVYRVVVPEEKP